MTNDYPDFLQLTDEYTEHFHASPGEQLLQELAELYERHPAITLAKLSDALIGHKAGRIHSPWGFTLEAMRRYDQSRASRPQRTDDTDLRDAERLAGQWTRNTGLYCPTEAEYLDALFGQHGAMKAWHDDQPVRDRMLALYREHRPRGAQAELDQRGRAKQWRSTQAEPPDPDANLA